MYYTPESVIDFINGEIIDPAAGTGGFLVNATRPLRGPFLSNPPFTSKPPSQKHDTDEIAGSSTGKSGLER